MAEDLALDGGEDDGGDWTPPLPEKLASLIGAIQGPADLGRNHDKYLAYPTGSGAGGTASA